MNVGFDAVERLLQGKDPQASGFFIQSFIDSKVLEEVRRFLPRPCFLESVEEITLRTHAPIL
jgi:hypothetical protein